MFDEIVILTIFLTKWRIFYILLNLQRSIPLKLIGQLRYERCQKKHKIMKYKIL